MARPPKPIRKKTLLMGLGLDGEKGETRITKGDDLYLVGGSKETHEFMQDKSLEFCYEVKKRCKTLDEISLPEFMDIAKKIKMFNKK